MSTWAIITIIIKENSNESKSLNLPLKCYKIKQQQQLHFGGPGYHLPSPPTYLFQVMPNQRVGNLNRKGNQLSPLTT